MIVIDKNKNMKKIFIILFIFCGINVYSQTPSHEINGNLQVNGCIDGYFPYASILDTTDQTTSSTTTAYPITFNVNDVLYGISHTAGDSIITFNYSGKFLITFSSVFQSSAPNKTFNVWLRKNHVNIPISNTVFTLLGTAQNRIVTVTYIVSFTKGDIMTLVWQSNDTGGKLDYTTSQTNPVRPVCPSIILTINKISK